MQIVLGVLGALLLAMTQFQSSEIDKNLQTWLDSLAAVGIPVPDALNSADLSLFVMAVAALCLLYSLGSLSILVFKKIAQAFAVWTGYRTRVERLQRDNDDLKDALSISGSNQSNLKDAISNKDDQLLELRAKESKMDRFIASHQAERLYPLINGAISGLNSAISADTKNCLTFSDLISPDRLHAIERAFPDEGPIRQNYDRLVNKCKNCLLYTSPSPRDRG